MGPGSVCMALGQGILADGVVAFAFYRSFAVFMILLIPAAFYPFYYRKKWREKQKRRLEMQFKEAIEMVAGALCAGYSAENAVAVCSRELELLYGPKGMIVQEFSYMVRQMELNRSIEELIQEFAGKSGLEEAERFAQIFKIAKRSGGQLVPVIRRTVSIMEERYQVQEEIRTVTASVQFEQKVMSVIPFFMIFYIDFTSPGFFRVMYETVLGRVVMSGCLAVYLLSCWAAKKIMQIKIG